MRARSRPRSTWRISIEYISINNAPLYVQGHATMAGAAAGVSFSLKERMNYILKYNQGNLGLFQRITTPQEYYELTGKDDFYDQKVYLRDDERVFVFIMCGLEYEIEDVIYYEHTAVRSDKTMAYSSESGSEPEAPESETESLFDEYPSEFGSDTEAPESETGFFNRAFFQNPQQREKWLQELKRIAPYNSFLNRYDQSGYLSAWLEGYTRRRFNRDAYIDYEKKKLSRYSGITDERRQEDEVSSTMRKLDYQDKFVTDYMERRRQDDPSPFSYGFHVV